MSEEEVQQICEDFGYLMLKLYNEDPTIDTQLTLQGEHGKLYTMTVSVEEETLQ